MFKPARWRAYLILILLVCPGLAAQGDFTLSAWPTTSPALKPLFVKAIMEQAASHKVQFTRTPEFYQIQLDELASWSQDQGYAEFLKAPVAQNLATLAVIHCDWHNGVAPREFAQKYLGLPQLERLRAHYPEAIAALDANCP